MIIRIWEGRTLMQDGDKYEKFMIARAAPDYASVDGLDRLYFCRRDDQEHANFLFITHWWSEDAVAAFTSGDPSTAKYYPEDDHFLVEQQPAARNYSLFHCQVK